MNKNSFWKNFLIYFALILGYFFLYSEDIESTIYGDKETKSESKIDFVYQQF
jgi:hypothetical protein